jgi:hypothetical protein
MKRIAIIMSLISSVLLAQDIEMSETELRSKLDSVLAEAHVLYKYEKVAWVSSDLAMEDRIVKKNYGGILVYEIQGEMKVIILSKTQKECIAEYSFESDFSKPKSVAIEKRELLSKEKELLELKITLLENISHQKYGVTIPEGYSPNLIFIPFDDMYKMYIIMGTSQRDVIPFGNDYLFIADKNGEIESWQKFHSGIIPGYTKYDGYKVTELTHSHLRTTPLITATDICTFMLYAPLYDIDAFSVYSPAIGKYMKYSLNDDTITVSPK